MAWWAMGQQTDIARTLERIAAELGVPVSAFHERDASSDTAGALQTAVAALLSAFTMVRDPAERQHCVDRLSDEATRLRALAKDDRG